MNGSGDGISEYPAASKESPISKCDGNDSGLVFRDGCDFRTVANAAESWGLTARELSMLTEIPYEEVARIFRNEAVTGRTLCEIIRQIEGLSAIDILKPWQDQMNLSATYPSPSPNSAVSDSSGSSVAKAKAVPEVAP